MKKEAGSARVRGGKKTAESDQKLHFLLIKF
jgi:hypothetical protein